MEKIQRWKDAFVDAGKIAGHDLKNYNDEADCIKKLIDDIFSKSLQGISHFPENLVGMKSQIEEVISLLDMESNDVRFIGIWGMGGIGKTEIANFLHQRLRHQFETHCFLGDVGELYQKNGLTWLEQVVISKLLGERMTLTSKHEGMDIIKSMLRRKKILFILDNVNHQEQLQSLVGRAEWFGKGSRIILTARDKHLLISHVGDNMYEVQLLLENEALELFSRHAFREKSPIKDFMELSTQVVEYAGGLPLALKVLGSSFYKRDKEQWRDRLDRLKKIPHNDILGKLRVSFDELDKEEKRMFLDIACLYNHETRDYVERVFKSCGIHLIGIDNLVEKSLLSIDRYPRILMHNMIREMGEYVTREEYTNSRIWLPEEVRHLFAGKMQEEKVESMRTSEYQYFKDEVFKKMQSLQVLKIDKKYGLVNHSTITYLPSSLRWIDWESYPSSSLPENFEPLDLVGLSLVASSLVKLWPTSKKLSNLKYLNLSDSLGLTKAPNFSDIPNLETLILKWCKNLEEVHPSLGHCKMLTLLHLKGCGKLKKLPKFVSMESLETLNLGECTSLEKFPKICGDMQRLSKLYVGSPRIRSLSLSLCGLSYLSLKDCEDLESIPNTIQNLESLWISGCNTIATLPSSLFESEQLEKLVIAHCSRLVDLPISLGAHKKLLRLELRECENLKKLPNSIQMESLVDLRIFNCPKLDTFSEINGDMYSLSELAIQSTGITELPSSIGNLSALKLLSLVGCEHLATLPKSLCNMNNLRWLQLRGCNILEKLPENIGDLQELEELDARETAISQLPLSTTKLGKLNTLKFSHKHSSSFVLHQVSGLSSLTRLHLSNCNILGGLPEDLGSLHSLEYLILKGNNISWLPKSIKKLLRLKYLNVQLCKSLNELPRELPPNLELLYADYHLALKSIRDITDNGLAAIGSSLSSLQALDVSYCRKITDKGLSAVAEGCCDLRTLHLAGCRFVSDSLMKALSKNCHNLEELGLQGCTNITNSGLSVLVEGCRRIKHLDINKCSNIGDIGISSVSEACSLTLKTLKLLDCYKVGDDSIVSLANYCNNIETLVIGGCRNISDESMKSLAAACNNSLRKLRMDWCLNITDSSLDCIISKCRKLEVLDIGCCEEVTDAAFQQLGSENIMLGMKILKVSNCPKITVEGIKKLMKSCEHLEYLDVRSCPLITKAGCEEAGLQFPESCKINFTGSLAEPDVLL